MPKKTHSIGFDHALEGIIFAFTHHPNFIFHLLIGSLALTAGIILDVSSVEFLLLFILFIIGLVIEMINTAIESVVDLVTQEWRQNAKIAKDVASGAMLIFALGSSLIAFLIFVPKLI